MKKTIAKFITLILVVLLAGCSPSVDTSELPYSEYINDSNPEVIINFDGYGKITLQLFPDVAPTTVNNFLELAQDEFYSDVLMHRVITDFMIQGGDPDGDGTGGSENRIIGEFSANNFENNLSHSRGVLSMARSQINDSASSQFFIVHQDSVYLDGNYAAFGGVIKGFDVLDKIATAETDTSDRPLEDIKIKSVQVELNDYIMGDTEYAQELTQDFFTPGEFRNETNPQVLITFSDEQQMTIELFPEVAPLTVEHFLAMIEDGTFIDVPALYADETLMQFGPSVYTTGFETTVKGEFKANGINNELSHTRGVISLLRGTDYNSASNHFVILHQDDERWNGYLAGFGAITTGFETLDYIANLERDDSGSITEEYTIKSIEIIQ